MDIICGTYFNADSWHILTSTKAKAVTDHYTGARRIFPNAVQDPSCSTRVQSNFCPGCDSSFWRSPRFRRHTTDPQCSCVRADSETTTPGTFCRSLLPLCVRYNNVLTLRDCNLRHLQAVHSTITVYQNYNAAFRRLAPPLGCIMLALYVDLVGADVSDFYPLRWSLKYATDESFVVCH